MAPGTVSSKVRAAHRGRTLLIAIESSIVGLSTGIATLAVGATARVDPNDPQTVALLVLVGILGALTWWMERRGDAASVARSIDRRSGLAGALTTAFETESVANRTPVAAALAASIAPLVSPRRFLAREMRSSAAVLAAPFLALALLGAVTEGRVSLDDPRDLDSAVVSSSSTVLGRSADLRARARHLASSPGISAQEIAALRTLAQRAGPIDTGAAAPEASMAKLEADLAEIARRIEASRNPAPGAGVASGGRDGTMGGRDPRIDRPTDGPMRETPSSNPPPNASAPAVPGSGAEGGVGASRWWPERYDGVVERWIEARRAAAGGRSR